MHEINNQSNVDAMVKDIDKGRSRKVKSGYPRKTKFMSIDEVREYLNQDKIDCLICGRRLKSLSAHLAKIHRLSTDNYKIKYGLPFWQGLTSKGTASKLADCRRNDSLEVKQGRIDLLKLIGPQAREKTNRETGFKALTASENIKGAHKPRRINKLKVEQVINKMETEGLTLKESINATYGIEVTAFSVNVKLYPELLHRYNDVQGWRKNHKRQT